MVIMTPMMAHGGSGDSYERTADGDAVAPRSRYGWR